MNCSWGRTVLNHDYDTFGALRKGNIHIHGFFSEWNNVNNTSVVIKLNYYARHNIMEMSYSVTRNEKFT